MFANSRALSSLPSARLVNSVPPGDQQDAARAEPLLEQRALAVRGARQRQHEVVVRHAQRPFLGLVVGLERRASSRPRAARAGPVAVSGIFSGTSKLLSGFDLVEVFVPRRRPRRLLLRARAHPPRARAARAACRRAAPRAPRCVSNSSAVSDSISTTAPDERPRRPARLVEQRRVDQQRVAAPHPLVERAELVVVEHLDAGQREHQQVAARRQVRVRQRRVALAERAHLHAGLRQPVEQTGVSVAAPFGAGRARGIARPDRTTATGAATARRTPRVPRAPART